eukprot:6417214-Pyramimonas_sp.AAC.1
MASRESTEEGRDVRCLAQQGRQPNLLLPHGHARRASPVVGRLISVLLCLLGRRRWRGNDWLRRSE